MESGGGAGAHKGAAKEEGDEWHVCVCVSNLHVRVGVRVPWIQLRGSVAMHLCVCVFTCTCLTSSASLRAHRLRAGSSFFPSTVWTSIRGLPTLIPGALATWRASSCTYAYIDTHLWRTMRPVSRWAQQGSPEKTEEQHANFNAQCCLSYPFVTPRPVRNRYTVIVPLLLPRR